MVKSRNIRPNPFQMKGMIALLSVLFLGALGNLPFGIVHASNVATALPGVIPSDNATYTFTGSWQTNNATAFPTPPFFTQLIGSHVAIQITAVQGANVTLTTTTYYLNGTSFTDQENRDVQTQSWCVTSSSNNMTHTLCGEEGAPPGAIIAAGLQASDAIGANPSITLNQTVTRTILGAQRTVNFLNLTQIYPASYCTTRPVGTEECAAQTVSFSVAWDQASGIAVESILSETLDASVGHVTELLSYEMASTNIFTTSVPEFSISSSPSNVTVQGGGHGSSTITLLSLNGFTGTVGLQASTSSAQLSCSLSSGNVTFATSPSSLTISCSGSKGTYTVTVTGTAGSLSHSTTLTFTILHGRRGQHF